MADRDAKSSDRIAYPKVILISSPRAEFGPLPPLNEGLLDHSTFSEHNNLEDDRLKAPIGYAGL
jgi:hypothetical protein